MNLSTRLARMREADLYVVITGDFCAGRDSLEVLDACLSAGVRMVQLREKHMGGRELHSLAQVYRDRTLRAGALFIVNDRVDIALAVQADGVHLGQSDLPLDAARRLAPEFIVGASTHTLEEALAAQDAGAGYVNIGPIFPTRTKEVASGAVGPELIETIAPNLHIPFTCMGGITLENIDQPLARGAGIIAVVTAVTAAPDVQAAAEALRKRILELRH